MHPCLSDICSRINRLLAQRETVLIAIEGNCTAGKTTLSHALQERYGCNVFHMDDYFLQPYQRTPQRLAEAGGNVDYERFWQEILLPVTQGNAVHYRPFDCGTMALKEALEVPRTRLTIVEGTYSCHPYFRDSYDLRLFLRVTPEVQRQRILERPEFLHRRFFEEWIPMEQHYFDTFRIRECCDMVLNGGETL